MDGVGGDTRTQPPTRPALVGWYADHIPQTIVNNVTDATNTWTDGASDLEDFRPWSGLVERRRCHAPSVIHRS